MPVTPTLPGELHPPALEGIRAKPPKAPGRVGRIRLLNSLRRTKDRAKNNSQTPVAQIDRYY